MTDAESARKLSHPAVEAAIRALAATTLKTKSDAMLRAFLAFKTIHRDGYSPEVETGVIKSVVQELFEVLHTPPGVSESKFSGTLALRGIDGRPRWLRNDSYRGSWLDYVGPNSPGRLMFEEGKWRRPVLDDAVELVVETLDSSGYGWPPRDALAAIVLRNKSFDTPLGWDEVAEMARDRLGLSTEEWYSITSSPALLVPPFDGDQWDPELLSRDLLPVGSEKVEVSEQWMGELPPRVAFQVERVVEALAKHGRSAIVALAGVPGTSKSYVSRLAARAFASEDCLREIQFHPGYTYEEFIEGPRFGDGMEMTILPGAFLELNQRALLDPASQYVLLIEEMTRADLPRVLGELLTYVEYRDEGDEFTTMYRRDLPARVAPNLAILATYNPADRSAIGLDSALIRRMRILDFPPSTDLLREILSDNGVEKLVADALVAMFDACSEMAGDRFEEIMPFGHAIFATVESENDLYELWHETIKRILIRPYAPRHELFDVIFDHYPWQGGQDVSVIDGTPGNPTTESV